MDVLLKDINPVIQLLIVMTLFSLLPFVFCCMTSFLRFTIVFSMLKTALGTQSVPPAIVLIGLSMILTFYSMSPVFDQMIKAGEPAYKSGNIVECIAQGSKPLKEFMLKQTRQEDLVFFIEKTRTKMPETPEDLTLWEVAPAYILCSNKHAKVI